jgi:uncharacterized secreted protein with C-terminal beta-propeller domain
MNGGTGMGGGTVESPGGRRRRRTAAAGVAAAIAVAAAVGIPVGLTQRGGDRAGGPPELPPAQLAAQLTAFDACPQLLTYLHGRAHEQVTAYGLAGGGGGPVPLGAEPAPPSAGVAGRANAADAAGAAPAPAPAGEAAAGVPGGGPATGAQPHSGTNVQVADVDEPDTVKTDGRLLVSVAGDTLRVLDATTPRRRGALTFAQPVQELLLAGDRAVVFGAQYAYSRPESAPPPALPRPRPDLPRPDAGPVGPDASAGRAGLPSPAAGGTTATVVDLADPDRPRVLRTFRFTGTQVAARVVDGTIRFVLRADPPALNWTLPSGTVTEKAAVEANRRLVEQSTIDDWLPRYRIDEAGATPSMEGPLVACENVLRPGTPADLSMITVLSLDPEEDRPGRGTSVVGGGDTVYAESNALYVAGTRHPVRPLPADGDSPTPGAARPNDPNDARPNDARPNDIAPSEVVTQVHQFDVARPTQARYVASGQVRGSLLNSYALSAAHGKLRVATTRQNGAADTSAPTAAVTTDNAIAVLEVHGRQLVEVGQVGGLGVGEQIYAVRYLGDVAWVVTFRQTDPLYAVDLSDPRRPAVRGELKLPGFSTYLLPLPGDRLLGVGESSDGARGNGTKTALFDVSDLSAPRLVDDEVVPDTLPQVSGDPHAFLWWAPANLAVVPAAPAMHASAADGRPGGRFDARADGRIGGQPDGRALAFRVNGAVGVAGRLGRAGEAAPVTRAAVVGDRLLAVSSAGVQVHDLATLRPGAWVHW